MKQALGVVAVLITTILGAAQQANTKSPDTSSTIRFRAAVVSINQIDQRTGSAIPVDLDPHYLLALHIDSAVPSVPEFKSGSSVIFAIHSPTLVFGGDPQKRKSYDFAVCREGNAGKAKYSHLGVTLKRGSLGGCG